MACKSICFAAVSDNMRPAMSETSLDFGFFCDVSQNLKARHFLADLLGNRSLLQRVQKVMVCDLRLVDFDLLCIVCQEDLCYDVLLCDVNFSRFSFHIFCCLT